MKTGRSICLLCLVKSFLSSSGRVSDPPRDDQPFDDDELYHQIQSFLPRSPIPSQWTNFPFRKPLSAITCPVPGPSSAVSSQKITSSKTDSDPQSSSSRPLQNKERQEDPLPRLLSFSEWKAKGNYDQPYRKPQRRTENNLQDHSQALKLSSSSDQNVESDQQGPRNSTLYRLQQENPERCDNQAQEKLAQNNQAAQKRHVKTRSEGSRFWNLKSKFFSNPNSSLEFNHDPLDLSLSNLSFESPPTIIQESNSNPTNPSFEFSPSDGHPTLQPEVTYHPDHNTGTGNSRDPLKTLSSRTNYASFDCSASIHRSSKHAKSASSILNEKKDKYMLTPCKAPKSNNRMSRKNYSSNTNNIEESANFVVFELCDEIEIDTVVLANFEFFSSMFKLIRISVSSGGLEGASGVEWLKVGIFKTRNVRGLQVFPIRNLKGFYRYVRLDFLSHHGSEYYCPLSLVRIYGLTQIDAFRREQEEERRKIESIQILETEERRKDTGEVERAPVTKSELEMRELFNRATPNETDTLPDGSQSTNYDKKDESNISTSDSNLALAPSDTDSDLKPATAESGYGFDQRSLPQVQEKQADGLHHTTSNQPSLSEEAVDQHSSSLLETNKSLTPPSEPPATAPSQYEHTMDSPSTLSPSKISEILNETPPEQTGSPSASGSESRSPFSDLLVDSNRQPLTGSQPNENESLDEQQQQSIQRETVYSRVETPLVGAAPPSSESLSSASNEGKKTQPVPSNPDPPRPQTYSKPSSSEKAPPNGSGGGGQSSESIFGQITKRLNYLDSNHDLALKYVEEQSKLLESSLRLLDQRLLEFESQLKSQDVKQKKTLRDLNELKRKLSVERTLHKHQIESLDSSMTFIKSFGLIQFVSILAVLVFLALTRFQETSVTNPSIVTKRPRPLSNLRVETQKNRLNLLKSNLRSKPGFISGKEASSTPKRFHHSHLKCASSVSASAKSPSPLSEFEVLRKPTTVSWLRGSNISSTKVSSFRDLPSSVAQEKVQNQYSRKETKAQGCKLRSLSQSYGGSCAPNLSPQPKPYSLIRPKHARLRSISDCAGLLRPNLTSPMKNVLSGENPQRNPDQLICGNNQFSKTMNTENDVINNNEFLRRTKDDFIFPVEEIRIHGLSFPKGSGSKDAMATYEGCIDSFGNLRSNFDEFKRRQQQQLHHQRNDSCNSHSEWMTECSGVSSSLESEDEEFERLSKISEQGGLIVKTGCIGEEKIVEKEGLMNQEFKVKPKVEQCSIDGLPPSYRSAVKVTQ